jgi:formate dehydrogenase iron-sulfur subunit
MPVWSFVKDQCLHCKDPACVSVCPVQALRKTKAGPVTFTYDRCIGCRYCMVACPFRVPKYEWDSVHPWVQKCSFCSERIKDGMQPACIKACPTGTLFYDEHDSVVAEARRRLRSHPEKYLNHIYGLEEAGGTSWLYLSAVPFEQIGFKTNISNVPLPSLTWEYIIHIPALFGIVFVAGLGSWIITRRIQTNESKEQQE